MILAHENNLIVKNEFFSEDLVESLFGPMEDSEGIIFIESNKTMPELLVELEFFKSKGDVKRNWSKTGIDIPKGFSDFTIGKLRRRLTIWNPIGGD